MCSNITLIPSDMIASSSMLNVVWFCWSSGIEVDEDDAPVAVALQSNPLYARYLKAGGRMVSVIAPVIDVVDISLNVDASSLMLPENRW